jgi:cysteine desulfurase/selenocysteine lyase
MSFDADAVRRDFPGLDLEVHGRPLVYLDNAAATHKPQAVLDEYQRVYLEENANVHRGIHTLSQLATEDYERARRTVARYLNAPSEDEIVFVRGTTEAINLVAWTFGRQRLVRGTNVVISALEHHSNIVPWQLVTDITGAELRVIPLDDRGDVTYAAFEATVDEYTAMISVAHISNALGTILPVKDICRFANERRIPVLIDGAQGMSHDHPDVQELGCDFYAFSGHKVFAPTGIGALWGKMEHLSDMPPWHGGGEMIETVTFEGSTYAEPPARFEAGTPNFAGAIAMGRALEYLEALDEEGMLAHEADLLEYGTQRLLQIEGLRIIGTAPRKSCVLSFIIEGIHPHDIGAVLDQQGIAVRVGHHCAQPVMAHFGLPATTRASLSMYNTRADIDALVEGLKTVKMLFS